jgi:hypothetical protein
MKTNRIPKQALGRLITGTKVFLDGRRKAEEFKYVCTVHHGD